MRSGWRSAAVVIMAGAMLCAPAWAALRERLMEEAGIEPLVAGSVPSIRLAGMGGLWLAVPDEANELNAHDFAGSVSGVLEDADGWTVDCWAGRNREALEESWHHFERSYGHAGTQVVRRSEARALGLDFSWSQWNAPNEEWAEGKVGGPVVSALVNQRVGLATLGLMVGVEGEEERRDISDFFAIQHQQDRWVGQAAAQADVSGMQMGANWEFQRGDVVGKSEDPSRFHQDDYIWSYPRNRFGVFWLLPRRGALEGGVRAAFLDAKGSERILISWSDRSPRNPSRSNYRGEAVTFYEEESDLEASTSWRFHARPGLVLGAEAGYRDFERTVEEGVNYKGSLREGFTKRETVWAGAGLSYRLMGERLLAALEGRGAVIDGEWEVDDEAETATARSLRAGLGLEYFATHAVVLRAGIFTGSDDRDLDQPLSLTLYRGVSGGVSWLPRGGTIQFHAALQYERVSRENDEAVDLESGSSLGYAVGLRLLP